MRVFYYSKKTHYAIYSLKNTGPWSILSFKKLSRITIQYTLIYTSLMFYCMLCMYRSLRYGVDDQILSPSEITELVQEGHTKHNFHFDILAKLVQ